MISLRFAFISILLYSFGLAFFKEIWLSMLLAPLFLALVKPKSILPSFKKLLFLNIFILLVSLSAVLSKEYNLALLIFVRANAILFFTFLLFDKRDIFEITASLSSLGLPTKLSTLFFFVAKFIFIIKNEFQIIKKALLVRHFKRKTTLFTYKIYANIVGMLVVKCFERADKLKKAMILRNFGGKIYYAGENSVTKMDLVLLCFVLASIFLKIIKVNI